MSNQLTETDLMPFGKYKGEEMQDVPASYLLWLRDEMSGRTMYDGSDNQKVAEYIEENLDVLEKEVEEEDAKKTKHKRD